MQTPTPPPLSATRSPLPSPPEPGPAVREDGQDPRIITFLRNAEAFLKQNDFRNALVHIERGLEAGARGELYGALRTRQAEAHRWRGELVAAERAGSEAMGSLPPGSELWWLAAREAMLSAGSRSDAAKVSALGEEMMRLLPALKPDAASAGTLASMATYLMHTGHKEALVRFLRWAGPLLRDAAAEPPVIAARLFQILAVRAIHEGNLGAYLQASEAAAERFAAAHDMRNGLAHRVNAGFAKIELGAYGHAEADLRAAIGGAERLGLNHVVLAGRANLGIVLARRGNDADARTLMIEVLKESMSEGDRRFEASARTQLSLILLASGDTAGAVREARGAIDMTPPSAPARIFALGALAYAHLGHERPVAALETAEQAMEMLEALGGGIEEGESLVRLVFALAKRQTGDLEGASAAIEAARDRLDARAQMIADPALRKSFLGGVAENVETVRLAVEWRREPGEWPA